MPPIHPIPHIPPPPIGGASVVPGTSKITASVVRNIPAIDVAFSRAVRGTLVGSIIPAATRSVNSFFAAS